MLHCRCHFEFVLRHFYSAKQHHIGAQYLPILFGSETHLRQIKLSDISEFSTFCVSRQRERDILSRTARYFENTVYQF